MKIIHLTDTHVTAQGQLLYDRDPALMLRRAVASINAEHGDAACVVLTGDLTEYADPEAYAVARAELDRLTVPLHLMVGNHDEASVYRSALPDLPRDPDGFAQQVIETEAGRLLLLDTQLEGSHAGGYCAARQAWLAARLEENDDPVYLFLHHPPFAVGLTAIDEINLKDAEAFYAVLEPHKPRIRHLFFGHVHRAIFGNWRGISFSCMRGLNHQLALDMTAGSGDYVGSFEQPAYGVALLEGDQVVVHLHCFTDETGPFEL